MAKKADGFELKFTHRGSWMVQRIVAGRTIDVIPVAWARDFRPDPGTGRKYQKVKRRLTPKGRSRAVLRSPVRLPSGLVEVPPDDLPQGALEGFLQSDERKQIAG